MATWDSYIDDFASKMPDQLDALFAEADGYPGIHDPNVKDYIMKYQIKADEFYSAYPNTTVTEIRKGQRVLQAWEELLDASEWSYYAKERWRAPSRGSGGHRVAAWWRRLFEGG